MSYHNFNGFLNIYKPSGWTSMDVCAKLRGMLKVKRVGHAGTLDPMAEGVLPVAVGRATKDIEKAGSGIKEYKAKMLLGISTDTQDITGRPVSLNGLFVEHIMEKEPESKKSGPDKDSEKNIEFLKENIAADKLPAEESIRDAALSFLGEYEQLTPMYSARKVGGKRLYEYARAGIDAERKTKKVTIYDIRVDGIELPFVSLTVRCSRGTYIRTLCSDIGDKLGCGACMSELTRTKAGDFDIADALSLDDIEGLKEKDNLDSAFRILAPTAIAIGKFDGTHIGHQELLKELKKQASKYGLRTCVIIFKTGKDFVISNLDRKRKMYGLGIDYCIELEFNEEMKNMSAGDFLKNFLIDRYNMKAIAAGEDVSFGKNREGDAKYLRDNAGKYGYSVHIIKKIGIDLSLEEEDIGVKEEKNPNYKLGDECGAEHENNANISKTDTIISSTLLRAELVKGDMLHVTRLLGTPYSISGLVVHGNHVGTDKLSMPTINIEVPDKLILPPRGVYAANVIIYDLKTGKAEKNAKGIANLGFAPTVSGNEETGALKLETHVFDNIGDCYGMDAKIELCYFIRHERMFESLDKLKEQVFSFDIPEVKKYFDIT